MKQIKILWALAFCIALMHTSFAQKDHTPHTVAIQHFQEELNQEYADSAKSPLPKKDILHFKGLPFFPIDSAYRVEAKFKRTLGQLPFYMPTTSGSRKMYEKYGEVHFTMQGKKHVLTVYQSHALRETAAYKDYLFLPFSDETNAHETYGSGRFMDLRIPAGNTIELDFNKAYNPYCSYNTGYACPIPPKENHLKAAIRAGVKAPKQVH